MYKFIGWLGSSMANVGLNMVKWALRKQLESIVNRVGNETIDLLEGEKVPILIHQVIRGPVHKDELEEPPDWVPEDAPWNLYVKIEEDGEVRNANLWYVSEEEAREVEAHFKTSIEPLELEL